MSGRIVNSDVPKAVGKSRRTVSVYDKMQEARERRAALLSVSDPANLPRAATPARPVSEPVPSAAEHERPSPPMPEVPATAPEAESRPAHRPGVATKWTIRALVVLLAVLVGIAAHMAGSERIDPGPQIAPPVASLPQPAMGPPMLIQTTRGADPAIASTTAPPAPPGAVVPELPRAAVGETRPRGPEIADSIDVPIMPAVSASALVVLPNEVLPPERPDFTATGQSGG